MELKTLKKILGKFGIQVTKCYQADFTSADGHSFWLRHMVLDKKDLKEKIEFTLGRGGKVVVKTRWTIIY